MTDDIEIIDEVAVMGEDFDYDEPSEDAVEAGGDINPREVGEIKPSIVLDGKQLEAVKACCDVGPKNRIVAVTGQAGTGKTTIMKEVYNALTEAGYAVVLCAPTGKAAKRIQEATGIPAVTIHRLLQYPHPGDVDPKTGKPLKLTVPLRGKRYPLTQPPYHETHFHAEVVLADEYAMVSHELHRNLIDALDGGGCLRVFGDMNQLPPVESNKLLAAKDSPFLEVLKKQKSITLDRIHRQAEGSGIVMNGDRILKKQMPTRTPDFTLKITDKPIHELEDIVYGGLDRGVDFSSMENQIITPGNKLWIGTHKLNAKLQLIFRPETDKWLKLERHEYEEKDIGAKHIRVRPGDKVIWAKNNYFLNVFNGETGIVIDTNEDTYEFTIDFGDRLVVVPPVIPYKDQYGNDRLMNPQKDCNLAYAVTTHKSQGSEFKEVVYIINTSHSFMLNHNNFYTAVTRAKNVCHVIADQRGIYASLQPPRDKQPVRR